MTLSQTPRACIQNTFGLPSGCLTSQLRCSSVTDSLEYAPSSRARRHRDLRVFDQRGCQEDPNTQASGHRSNGLNDAEPDAAGNAGIALGFLFCALGSALQNFELDRTARYARFTRRIDVSLRW
jgi:hypothetical protein